LDINLKEGGHMKKKYDPELFKDDLKELIRQTLKEALEAELEEFLGYSKYERTESDNSRNGYISKTVKTAVGEVEIEIPRDRKGDFELRIVKKCQAVLEDIWRANQEKLMAYFKYPLELRKYMYMTNIIESVNS
jgi:transposase-like protein